MMLFIHLRHLKFYAYHGVYEEEGHVGNEFEVNITLGYQPSAKIIQDLKDTIDYTAVYKAVNIFMNEPVQLLETLSMRITEHLLKQFPLIQEVEVGIKKAHPVIDNFEGNVEIVYSKSRTLYG